MKKRADVLNERLRLAVGKVLEDLGEDIDVLVLVAQFSGVEGSSIAGMVSKDVADRKKVHLDFIRELPDHIKKWADTMAQPEIVDEIFGRHEMN